MNQTNHKHTLYVRILFLAVLLISITLNAACSFFPFSKESAVSGRNDLETLFQTQEQIERLDSGYSREGYVPEEQAAEAVAAVAALADDMKREGLLRDYAVSSSNVWMLHPSGIQLVYTPDTGLTDSIGLDSSCRIVTCQPYADSYPESLSEEMGLPDSAASTLSRLSSQWTFEDNYDMEEVSLDLLKELAGPQILLWHGHGGWTAETGPYLVTGETFDENRFLSDSAYSEDFQNGRLLLCTDGRIAVTGEFVLEYMDSLDDSLIYLAACQSGYDTRLADAFLEKGAAAVVVNTDTIRTAYNTRMMFSTMEGLTLTDSSTGELYTLSQAVDYAGEIWGNTDSVQFGGIGAEPIIIGEDIRFSASSEDVSQALQAYADEFSYLSGIYSGYFEHTSAGNLQYNYWADLPVQPLTSLIEDFDADGQDELLIVNTNPDYTLRPEMYEFTDGTVRLAAEETLPATAASISEDGYLECVIYQQDGRMILGFEERSLASHLGDGTLLRFTAVRYNGSDFQLLGTQEYMGSSGSPEEGREFEAGMETMGISVDFEEIFYDGTSIFSYLPSPYSFARSQTFSLWDYAEWADFMTDWYGDANAQPVEASLIEFR